MSNRYLHKHKWIAVLLCLCFMMSFILPGYAMDGGVDAGGSDVSVSDGGSSGDSGSGDVGSGNATGGGESGSGDTGSGGTTTGGEGTPGTGEGITGGEGTPGTGEGTTGGEGTPGTGEGTTGGESTPGTGEGTTGGEGTPGTGEGTTGGEGTPGTGEGTEITDPTVPGTEQPTTPQQPTEEEKVVCDVCGAAEGEHHVNSECPYFPHLVGCDGEGCTIESCACPCHQPSKLYERLMQCETYAAMDAELKGAEIWEYPLMSDGEKAAVQAKLAELKALDRHDVEGCTDECTGEDCACKCHNKFEHIEGCDGVNCAVEGCQCPCHAMSLFDRLIITTSMGEYDSITGAATEEELATLDALTEEQRMALDVHYMELLSIPVQLVSYTEAAPLVEAIFSMFDSFVSMFADEAEPEEDKLVLDKNATYDAEKKQATITLEAYTTGKVTTETTVNPCDIVIVVDQSKKLMLQEMTDGKKVGEVLQNALTEFVGNLENAHRVGFVTIGSGGSGTVSNTWYDLTTTEGQTGAENFINGSIQTGGHSAQSKHEFGFNGATTLFESSKEGNNKVVVFISAGCPVDNGSDLSFDETFANEALTVANTLKSEGTTIYTVGVFDGANGEVLPNATSNQENKYMHFISSNYPNAASMGTSLENGSIPDEGTYFLSAGSTADLNDAFSSITTQVSGSSVQLGESAEIIDTITPQFEMPENTTGVKFYTQAYLGNGMFAEDRVEIEGPEAEIVDDTLTVTGYDFDDNYVSENPRTVNGTDYYGQKLIIEFTVDQQPDFLGGNNVVTNTATSGVYTFDKDGNKFAADTFTPPQVNVPIPDVTVTAQDKNVYLLGDITAEQLKTGAMVSVGDVALDLSKANQNYGLADWQTKYVDINVVVKDAAGDVVATDGKLSGLTADTTYRVEAVVTPKEEALDTSDGAPATAVSSSVEEGIGNIYVFKPTVTVGDDVAYYGGDLPDLADNVDLDSITWKHGETIANPENMIGTAPELTFTGAVIEADAGKVVANKVETKSDIRGNITAKVGDIDISNWVSVEHQKCTGMGCTDPTDADFWIHVKTCTLTITKAGGNVADEPFVFNIKKDGANYTQATIIGTGEVTISELPVGAYSIAEDTGWSWRYTANNGNEVSLTSTTPTGSITCTNTNNNNKWLNGYSNVITNIYNVITGN